MFFGSVDDLELLVLLVLADVPVVVAEREVVSSLSERSVWLLLW